MQAGSARKSILQQESPPVILKEINTENSANFEIQREQKRHVPIQHTHAGAPHGRAGTARA